jgi:hypothetical protein
MEKQEMQQVMEMLKTMLGSMDAHQTRMEADIKAHKEEMLAKMDAMGAMKYNQEQILAKMTAWARKGGRNRSHPSKNRRKFKGNDGQDGRLANGHK